MASIIVVSGNQKGEFLPLGRRTSVIGRAENLPLQILDSLVSRRHLRVCFDESKQEYCVEDMQSKHGVSVNGRRLHDPAVLTENDLIVIGKTMLLFTNKDFDDRESALSHYKKVGERIRETRSDSV